MQSHISKIIVIF